MRVRSISTAAEARPVRMTISHISPVKWSILAVEGAIWRDFSTWEMMTPLAVLCGIGLLGFAVGLTILTRSD